MTRREWCVLSRPRGGKRWHRHLPPYTDKARAEASAALWTAEIPAREYDVREYESAPAPTHPNGQVRHPRRRRHRRGSR